MDWADDVSYAVHDFEDYVRARLIPAHSIRRDLPAFTDYAWSILVRRHSGAGLDRTEFDEAINRIADFTVDDPYGGSRSDEAILNEWVSARITECLEGDAVELTDSQDSPVKVDAKRQYVVEVLKLFPVYYVIDSPPFAAAQEGQRRVVAGLFDSLMRMVEKRRTSVPRTLHEIVVSVENEPSVSAERMHNREFVAARSVVDYICTLTEAQAFELYERFRGSSPSMFHGPWL
jgi:dGTPase